MSKRWTAKSPMSGYLVAIAATLVVLLLRLLLSASTRRLSLLFSFRHCRHRIRVVWRAQTGFTLDRFGLGLCSLFLCAATLQLEDRRSQDRHGPGFLFRLWRHHLAGLRCFAQSASPGGA